MKSVRDRLHEVLTETGLIAKKSLGQNFLVSDHVVGKILEEVAKIKPSKLIEVGPGPGALTAGLREMNLPLQLIELDRTMAEYWRGKGMDVMEVDALQMDWKPLMTEPNTVFVSNLPYQISSSIVIERSLEETGVSAMVLMFQKEVAQRIRAAKATDAYGLLSVIAQNFWDITTVTDAGPKDFSPSPKVASRVLAFRRKDVTGIDRKKFLGFVKAGFAQRRKLLKSNLGQWVGTRQISPEILLAKIIDFGLKETARAEELTPAQFRDLYEHLVNSRK
jgi:16S rRNA (adenine1518-N6/adenine1519-N6)-dimethyltransferase